MTPLRQRMIEDLQIRNRSPKTIKAYVAHVARFAQYFDRSPELLEPEDVRQYQIHLLAHKASWNQFNLQSVAEIQGLLPLDQLCRPQVQAATPARGSKSAK